MGVECLLHRRLESTACCGAEERRGGVKGRCQSLQDCHALCSANKCFVGIRCVVFA